jgi:hypothetical protein
MSVSAKQDVYDPMIAFFNNQWFYNDYCASNHVYNSFSLSWICI